jgi:hypothetical protein
MTFLEKFEYFSDLYSIDAYCYRLIPLGGVNSPSLGAEPYKNSFAKLFEKRTIPRRLCLEVVYYCGEYAAICENRTCATPVREKCGLALFGPVLYNLY